MKGEVPPRRGTAQRRTAGRPSEKRTLALRDAPELPELLEERQGQDLGVREPLYGLVAVGLLVEMSIGVVDETEEDGEGVFRSSESFASLWWRRAICRSLWWGVGWPSLYPQSTQHASSPLSLFH